MLVDHIKNIGEIKKRVHQQGHGKILYLMVSGSDLFGFRSPDSDVDYRGCFQTKTNTLLTTRVPETTIEIKKLKEGVSKEEIHERDVYEWDAVVDELGKEIGLLLAGNCNHYEHLFASHLITSQEHVELKNIFEENMNLKGLYDSYRGMAYQNYKKFILGGKHTVKKYLYVLRGLLAGTYVLETGQIEPNINVLAKYFSDAEVIGELVDLKQRGMEKDPINKNLDKYNQEVDKWFSRIDKLADEKINEDNFKGKHVVWRDDMRSKLDDWLHNTRLEYLDI